MDTTATADPPGASDAPPGPSYAPRFERPRHTPVKGVCAGLARATGTDATLWRVLFVVGVLFGGLGLALYVVAVVLMPAEGEPRSLADRLLHGPDRHLTTGQVLLLALASVLVSGLVLGSDTVIALVVIGTLGYLIVRSRATGQAVAASPGWSAPAAAAADPAGVHGPTWAWPPPPPARPEPARSPLTGITVSAALLVTGLLALLGRAHSIPAEVVLASALGVVGLGLVVGAWFGRAPWLVVAGLVLALATGLTAAARPVIDHGAGERRWTPTAEPEQSYRLGVGEGVLDLTRVAPRELAPLAITARVEVGHLLVLVPPGLRVEVVARGRLGEVVVDDRTPTSGASGRDTTHADSPFDSPATVRRVLGPEGSTDVSLDLSVGTGQVEVRRG